MTINQITQPIDLDPERVRAWCEAARAAGPSNLPDIPFDAPAWATETEVRTHLWPTVVVAYRHEIIETVVISLTVSIAIEGDNLERISAGTAQADSIDILLPDAITMGSAGTLSDALAEATARVSRS